MAGGAYVVFALSCAIAAAAIARVKGLPAILWFLIVLVVPPALLAAVLFRSETDEPEGECPRCGRTVKLHDALCTRCGQELEYHRIESLG